MDQNRPKITQIWSEMSNFSLRKASFLIMTHLDWWKYCYDLNIKREIENKNVLTGIQKWKWDCCGQLWVRHMFCGRTCDELYHFTFLHRSFWDTLRIPTDQVALARHSGVQVPVFPATGSHGHFPVPTYGSTWVVLWLLFCRSAPSTFPGTWSTHKGPFRGVPSHRLYSEIDHIHFSIEAQCVSHHLPPVDFHREGFGWTVILSQCDFSVMMWQIEITLTM